MTQGRSLPKDLEIMQKHPGMHISFLNLEINIVDRNSLFKLYNKRYKFAIKLWVELNKLFYSTNKEDYFPFFIVRMSHIDGNILNSSVFSSKKVE